MMSVLSLSWLERHTDNVEVGSSNLPGTTLRRKAMCSRRKAPGTTERKEKGKSRKEKFLISDFSFLISHFSFQIWGISSAG